jgi:dihydroxyacid dehydratase/phosphogluconate dehydratase
MFASSEHACDQWHSSRKFIPLTGLHCKLRPNTEGGPIALLQDGDIVTIDADDLSITMDVPDEVLAARRAAWVAPPLKYTRGTMHRYIKTVSSARLGCVTDE